MNATLAHPDAHMEWPWRLLIELFNWSLIETQPFTVCEVTEAICAHIRSKRSPSSVLIRQRLGQSLRFT